MATKKKTKKKQPESKRTAGKKVAPMKRAVKKKAGKEEGNSQEEVGEEEGISEKGGGENKGRRQKDNWRENKGRTKEQVRGKSQSVDTVSFPLERLGVRAGEQSGDLQGLSNVQGADSESVDELLEQGNAFEAEVVKGVQDAGDSDEGEVRTHEVPQDDVPGEYREKEE